MAIIKLAAKTFLINFRQESIMKFIIIINRVGFIKKVMKKAEIKISRY